MRYEHDHSVCSTIGRLCNKATDPKHVRRYTTTER
jgi:hypothetical protein